MPGPSEDAVFLGSLTLRQDETGLWALFIQDEGKDGEWTLIPPHMAQQLPMALAMIRSM